MIDAVDVTDTAGVSDASGAVVDPVHATGASDMEDVGDVSDDGDALAAGDALGAREMLVAGDAQGAAADASGAVDASGAADTAGVADEEGSPPTPAAKSPNASANVLVAGDGMVMCYFLACCGCVPL